MLHVLPPLPYKVSIHTCKRHSYATIRHWHWINQGSYNCEVLEKVSLMTNKRALNTVQNATFIKKTCVLHLQYPCPSPILPHLTPLSLSYIVDRKYALQEDSIEYLKPNAMYCITDIITLLLTTNLNH